MHRSVPSVSSGHEEEIEKAWLKSGLTRSPFSPIPHIGALIPNLDKGEKPWPAEVERMCRVLNLGESSPTVGRTQNPMRELVYTLPYRRFADILAGVCARLGVDADRYSFIAVDSHHLLLGGFPAHPLQTA